MYGEAKKSCCQTEGIRIDGSATRTQSQLPRMDGHWRHCPGRRLHPPSLNPRRQFRAGGPISTGGPLPISGLFTARALTERPSSVTRLRVVVVVGKAASPGRLPIDVQALVAEGPDVAILHQRQHLCVLQRTARGRRCQSLELETRPRGGMRLLPPCIQRRRKSPGNWEGNDPKRLPALTTRA